MSDAPTEVRRPWPPLRPEQDLQLRTELLSGLTDGQRRELWWWIRQRGLRVYLPDPPDPEDLDGATVFQIADHIRSRSGDYQQSDWVLSWFLYAESKDLPERDRALLASPQARSLALADLEPLPPWFAGTLLGQALSRHGWR